MSYVHWMKVRVITYIEDHDAISLGMRKGVYYGPDSSVSSFLRFMPDFPLVITSFIVDMRYSRTIYAMFGNLYRENLSVF
jgi:hypothetical protein